MIGGCNSEIFYDTSGADEVCEDGIGEKIYNRAPCRSDNKWFASQWVLAGGNGAGVDIREDRVVYTCRFASTKLPGLCLAADTEVTLCDRATATAVATAPLRDVRYGDYVLAYDERTRKTACSAVYATVHDADSGNAARGGVLAVRTAGGRLVRLTANHFVFVVRGGSECDGAAVAVAAADVRVGDRLVVPGHERCDSGDVVVSVAASARDDVELMTALTMHGTIIANGAAASTMATYAPLGVHDHAAAHRALAPARLFYALAEHYAPSLRFMPTLVLNAADALLRPTWLGAVATRLFSAASTSSF